MIAGSTMLLIHQVLSVPQHLDRSTVCLFVTDSETCFCFCTILNNSSVTIQELFFMSK